MIVAEIGVNWAWDNLTGRLRMVADTGCLWTKFQIFTKEMVPERFHDLVMDGDDVISVKDRCWDLGLSPIFTPMYPKAVAWCGSDHIKIRHKDKDNKLLIARAREKAAHVWISGKNVFCVPKYPATISDYDPLWKVSMEDAAIGAFPNYKGVSFHCPDISLIKRCEQSQYLEWHVKFSEDDPEAAWSIRMDDLKKLVEWEK